MAYGSSQDITETRPSEVRSDALLDSIMDVIEKWPSIENSYMCHGEPHFYTTPDLPKIRERIATLLSND